MKNLIFSENLKIIHSSIKPHKYSVMLLFILILTSALAETLGLGMIYPFLEVITNSSTNSTSYHQYLSPILNKFPDSYTTLVICGILLLLFLIKNILFIINVGFSARFVYRLQRIWSVGIMDKYMNAEYSFILSKKQGVLINDLISEPQRAAKLIGIIIDYISKVTIMLFLLSLMFFTNWQITLLIILIGLSIILLTRKTTGKYSNKVGQKRLELLRQMNTIGAESIAAIRQIKIFILESESCKKFSTTIDKLIQIIVKFNVIQKLPNPIIESLFVIGIVFAVIYLNYIKKEDMVDVVPTLGLFVILSRRVFGITSELFSRRMKIFSFIPSLKTVHKLFTSRIENEYLEKGKAIDYLNEDIVLKDIHFAYTKSKPLFQGLTIRIPKGKMTAIVGPSGSGKTTLVDLLFGFFKQQKGRILINSTDLHEISLRSWRSLLGYITQDVFLFNNTVRNNILIGKPNSTEEDLIAAAIKANTDQFIKDLPQGYDTNIGERGLKLSGGQRQRIAIARAIICDPEVFIFDEATSSLDSESERLIQKSINDLAANKTIIIISHRLSTVKNADVIYVLDKGHIVESGTFEELEKNTKGQFFKMRAASIV